MKVIIAGGGTGGHVYPGIAIARELLKEGKNEVLFVGTEQGIEATVLPREGLRVRFITAGKIKGMKLSAMMKTAVQLPLGLFQSWNLIREERPDVVIGVGGYSSWPVGMAASGFRIPLIIVEPNSYAGLANRNLGGMASRVVLCFPGTGAQGFFASEKTTTLGPLVREGIESGDRRTALADFGLERGKFTVLVMGGSGGAHAINMAMKGAAGRLAGIKNLQVLHQTGEKDAAEISARYRASGIAGLALPYIHDMAGAYAAADLVIARSGATTVAELAVCGKRAVLVPFPFAADKHQDYNASMLVARKAAEVVQQQDLTPETLAGIVQRYAGEGGEHGVPPMKNTAAKEIAEICKSYVQKN
jgi:UDP-N-acetylglucosamine--N-acetylmuramyl-(pentapeptide) pyrophosphoryl-undecaprenol N-acetylglucosamine transferase